MSTTREKLLHTSRELMLQNGYHAVSVDEICVQANVKKGSFYHFFDSKMNLALQTMEDDHQESKSVCDTIFSSLSSPTERFQNFLSTFTEPRLIYTGELVMYAAPYPLFWDWKWLVTMKLGKNPAKLSVSTKNIIKQPYVI